ncbi:hypothetical protein Q8A73_015295 [Channa argus]|nr:hypothetical protein Q8A73_015295 [Channa argus]
MNHPLSNGGNLHANNGGLNSGQQDPGLHSTSQEPGPSSHLPRTGPGRPYFYVHAPPPPPHILQYQWPMPLYYNPFEGFPGMGYGVAMPPFHPSLYMEPPPYMMPHPHILTDYVRLLHTQIQAPTGPYQNLNQSRRVRPTHPVIRTVNSQVQTEPIERQTDRSPLAGSDSGNGTASNSPSSTSSSQNPNSAEVDNLENTSQQVTTLTSSNVRDLQENRNCTSSKVRHDDIPPTETKAESLIRTPEAQKIHKDVVVQDNCSTYTNGHCNIWSVSSSESLAPVCSSSKQEDEVVKERFASASDIQMSWGSGTSQATVLKIRDKGRPHKDPVLPPETQLEQDNAEGVLQSKDSVGLKIIRLPFSFNELLSESQDITEICPYDISLKYYQRKEKMNDSVWSVESLPPFVPTKDWLLQNGMSEPKIIEMMEETEPETFSSKQESPLENKKQEKSYCSLEKDTPSISPAMEKVLPTGLLLVQNGVDVETKDGSSGKLCVPVPGKKMDKMSPPKGHLVDCGIQCNKLQELKCVCAEMRNSMGPNGSQLFNISEMKEVNTVSAERFYMKGRMQKKQKRPGHWRNKGSGGNSRNQLY